MSDKTTRVVVLNPEQRVRIAHAKTLTIDSSDLVEAAFDRAYRLGYANGHHDHEHGEEFDDDPGDAFEMYVCGDLD